MINVNTLADLNTAYLSTRNLLSLLRMYDKMNTPEAVQAINDAIAHIENATGVLHSAMDFENNRLVECACRMGV